MELLESLGTTERLRTEIIRHSEEMLNDYFEIESVEIVNPEMLENKIIKQKIEVLYHHSTLPHCKLKGHYIEYIYGFTRVCIEIIR